MTSKSMCFSERLRDPVRSRELNVFRRRIIRDARQPFRGAPNLKRDTPKRQRNVNVLKVSGGCQSFWKSLLTAAPSALISNNEVADTMLGRRIHGILVSRQHICNLINFDARIRLHSRHAKAKNSGVVNLQ